MDFRLIALILLLACSIQCCGLHHRHDGDSPYSPRGLNDSIHETQPGHELLKRWYGVKTLPATGVEQGYISPHYYPWPITCSNPKVIQPIRYCFKDERSATNLQPLVDKSNAAWAHAMVASSLTITVEPTCRANAKCICSDPGVAKDALMISDETRDDDEAWTLGPDCVTASTVGYRYIPTGQPNSPYRHYSKSSPQTQVIPLPLTDILLVKFCSLAPKYSWGREDVALRDMVHEFGMSLSLQSREHMLIDLGHVMGLQHEHQRPDRNQFIWFKCKVSTEVWEA